MTTDNSPDELRNLWQTQPPESLSISADELRRASWKLARKVFWRNVREFIAAAVVVVGYGYYFYIFHTALLRIGSALTVAGVLFVAYQLQKRGSATAIPEEMDARSCLDSHRAQLVRQRDLHATVWKWYLLPFVPGMTIFLLGQLQLTLAQPAAALHHGKIALGFSVVAGFCAAVFIVVGELNRWKARKLQHEIDSLDALKGPPG